MQNLTEVLSQKTDGSNPLFLTIALEELRLFTSHEALSWFVDQYISQYLVTLIDRVLTRIESGFNNLLGKSGTAFLMKLALMLIALSKNGIPEDDLKYVLGDLPENDGELPTPVSDLEFAQIKRAIRDYLYQTENGLSFFHEQFKLAVEKRSLQDPLDIIIAHQIYAAYLFTRGYDYPTTVRDMIYHIAMILHYHQQSPLEEQDIEDWWVRLEQAIAIFLIAGIKLGHQTMAFKEELETVLYLVAQPETTIELDDYAQSLMDFAASNSQFRGQKIPLDTAKSCPVFITRNKPIFLPLAAEEMAGIPFSQLDRVERLRTFVDFINAEYGHFVQFGDISCFGLQQIYNSPQQGHLFNSIKGMFDDDGVADLDPMIIRTTPPSFDSHANIALLKTFMLHPPIYPVNGVSFNGQYLVNCDYLDKLNVLEVVTGKTVKSFAIHEQPQDVAVLSDISKVVLCYQNKVEIWDIERQKCIRSDDLPCDELSCLDVTPDGDRWVACGYTKENQKSMLFCNDVSLNKITSFPLPKRFGGIIWLTADGNFAFVFYEGLFIINIARQTCTAIIECRFQFHRAGAVTPNGQTAIFAYYEGVMGICRNHDPQAINTIEFGKSDITAMALTHDGLYAAIGDRSGFIWLISLDDEKVLNRFHEPDKEIKFISILPYADKLITICKIGALRVWQTKYVSNQIFEAPRVHEIQFLAMLTTEYAVTRCKNNVTSIWSLQSEKIYHYDSLDMQAFDRAKQSLPDVFDLTCWQGQFKIALPSLKDKEHVLPNLTLCYFFPGGNHALLENGGIWQIQQQRLLRKPEHSLHLSKFSFSLDGQFAYRHLVYDGIMVRDRFCLEQYRLVSSQVTVKFDSRTGDNSYEDYGNQKDVFVLPDGASIIILFDNNLYVLDTKQGCVQRCFAGLGKMDISRWYNEEQRLTISPTGCFAFDFANNVLLNLAKQTRIEFPIHTPIARCCKFTPDGMKVLVGHHDHTLRLWSLYGELQACFPVGIEITTIANIPPAGQTAIGLENGEVIFLNLVNSIEHAPVTTAFYAIDIQSDGKLELRDSIVAMCPWCFQLTAIPELSVLYIEDCHNLLADVELPCLTLPQAFWAIRSLEIQCSHCKNELLLNPFICNHHNRDVQVGDSNSTENKSNPFSKDIAALWPIISLIPRADVVLNIREFIYHLQHSLGTDKETKQRVVENFPYLGQDKIDELLTIFVHDNLNFISLAEKHPEDVRVLRQIKDYQWDNLVESFDPIHKNHIDNRHQLLNDILEDWKDKRQEIQPHFAKHP